jgi:hypothetical protein
VVTARLIRGPKDPDAFRTKVYGARWYRDHLPADGRWEPMSEPVPAVTTIKRSWSKPFRKKLPTGLTVPLDAYWAAEYVADNRQTLAAMDHEQMMAMIATAPDRSLAKAADRGTAVHSIMESLAVGIQPAPELIEPEAVPFLPAALAFVEEWQPHWLMTEVVCFNREVGFGGCADALVVLPPPYGLTIVDWKSRGSGHGAYAEEACQLGGYASADYFVVTHPDTRELVRIDPPAIETAAVVSFTTDDGYALYPIDVGEAKRAFLAMYETWRVRRDGEREARKAIGAPAFPPSPIVPPVDDDSDQGSADGRHDVDHAVRPAVDAHQGVEQRPESEPDRPRPPEGTEREHLPDRIRARVVAIAHALGERGLPIPWPNGVAKISAGTPYTGVERFAIEEWCWEVEAILGLPFPPAGPPVAPDEDTGGEQAPDGSLNVAEAPHPEDEALEWAERGRALLALLDDQALARVCAEIARADAVRMSRVRFLSLQAVVTQVSDSGGVLRAVWTGSGPTVGPVEDIEGALLASLGLERPSKSEALRRARNVAKRLEVPAPRSYADLCADLLLAACVAVGHGVTDSEPSTTVSGDGG